MGNIVSYRMAFGVIVGRDGMVYGLFACLVCYNMCLVRLLSWFILYFEVLFLRLYSRLSYWYVVSAWPFFVCILTHKIGALKE